MNFDEAEAKFRELQARVQRGESISRAEYEDQVSQLAVQDDRGVLWEINPRTGKWMFFDGAEWVGGTPPGRDQSTVMPIPRPAAPAARPPAPTAPAPSPRPSAAAAPPPGPRPPVPAAPRPSVTPPPPARLTSPAPPLAAAAPQPSAPTAPASRPAVPTGPGAPAPRPSPPAPESIQPYVRLKPEQPPPAAAGAGATPAGTAPMPPRVLRQGPLGGPSREWVPLAIGAVVLLFCAVSLFVGGRLALSAFAPQPTSTRSALLALASSTPMATPVRLPTLTPPSPTPEIVMAKVIERSVNVRAGPSTKNKIISSVKKDQTISLIGRNEAGDWYQVPLAGSTTPAWVFGETLEITSGDPNTLPVAPSGPAPTATKAPPASPRPQVTPTPTIIGENPTATP